VNSWDDGSNCTEPVGNFEGVRFCHFAALHSDFCFALDLKGETQIYLALAGRLLSVIPLRFIPAPAFRLLLHILTIRATMQK
jgi:hypothetical protein